MVLCILTFFFVLAFLHSTLAFLLEPVWTRLMHLLTCVQGQFCDPPLPNHMGRTTRMHRIVYT